MPYMPQSLLGHEGLHTGQNPRLLDFTEKLEAACIGAVESGKMTKDLALIIRGPKLAREHYLNTEDFIDAVAANLRAKL